MWKDDCSPAPALRNLETHMAGQKPWTLHLVVVIGDDGDDEDDDDGDPRIRQPKSWGKASSTRSFFRHGQATQD